MMDVFLGARKSGVSVAAMPVQKQDRVSGGEG